MKMFCHFQAENTSAIIIIIIVIRQEYARRTHHIYLKYYIVIIGNHDIFQTRLVFLHILTECILMRMVDLNEKNLKINFTYLCGFVELEKRRCDLKLYNYQANDR